MNLVSLIALARQFGAKLEGQLQIKYLANEDGINIIATDSKGEWTARFILTKEKDKA